MFDVCKLYFPQKPFDLDPTGIAELSSQQIYANFYNIALPENWLENGQSKFTFTQTMMIKFLF